MVNFFNNKKGSAVLVIVFLALMGFFAITLLASDVIKSNLIMSKTQLNSTKAYFAAEVGLEQALYSVMRGEYELPDASQKNVFSAMESGNGVYNVDYNRSNSIRTFVSTGGYLTEHRSTEVSFCIPDCFEKDCDASDGCDGFCPSTCTTDVGCRNSQLADSIEVDGSEGSCCGTGKCYECSEGYVWDGSACVYDCVQQCEGLGCGDLDPNCNRACPGSCESDPGCVAGAAPGGTVVSPGASCCDIAGTSYTCYECAPGYGWNGSACVACDANVGLPYPGGSSCFDAGIYDCFGNQVLPTEQIAKGTSCAGGNDPQVALGMNEGVGVVAYDSTVNNNDGVFQGNDWPYRKEILIDHSKFTLDLIDFQFLLYISKDVGLFHLAQDDGDDIVFRDSSGNIIPHEIEYFQGTAVIPDTMGRLIAWLRIPQIYAAQDTKIYMYYGNTTVGSQQRSASVWNGYQGVWHLDDNTFTNSVTGGVSFGVKGTSIPATVYTGRYLPLTTNNNSTNLVSNSLSAEPTSKSLLVSAWVNTTQVAGARYIFNWGTGGQYGSVYGGLMLNGGRLYYYQQYGVTPSGITNVANGGWHNVALSIKDASSPCIFYVDGEIDSISAVNCPVNAGYAIGEYMAGGLFGSLKHGGSYYYYYNDFAGSVDEVRFSFRPFNQQYIKDSYRNQLDPASYIKSVGTEQSLPGGLANWVPSIYDQALEFNGSSNYLSFASGDSIPLNGNMTLEAWVYPYLSGTTMEIASKWGDSWGWYINNSNRQCFYIKRSNLASPVVCASTAIPTNTWTHLGVAYNKSGNQITFYINGVAGAPITLSYLTQGTAGSLEIAGSNIFTSIGTAGVIASRFSGRIDEFKAYDYVRTATQIQYDANKNVCNGDGGCVALSSPENNSGTYQSCNDICYADGKVCSSVGTDSAGTNGLMSVYNAGYCGTFTADCSTTIERNPEEATPFLCSEPPPGVAKYQTNWTNCNCTICDINFGSPCTGNVCIKPNTGITACDGTCDKPEFVTAGTSCGDNRECDGLGECRNVCHPLIGKPCGEDQCNNPGIVDCDGFCIGQTSKTDGINCEDTENTSAVDQCWGGVCTGCEANIGQPCNVGECLDAGIIDCFGGCTACEDGDCIANPNYAADNKPCDSGYGLNTGTCDGNGVCEPCDDDYLNLGPDCNTIPCYDAGLRDCETGICPTAALLPANTYCTTLSGDPGACTATGECTLCESGYMNACNNSTPCHRAGTIMCDGATCTTSGYLDEGDSCNAGYADNWAYPDTGYCNAAHSCITCASGYLNEEECNDGPCQIPGNYLCDGGCDACIDNNCTTNPRNVDDGDTCDTGAPTAQPYSGTCESGVCNSCATGFLEGDDCNTEECHEVGVVECDGTCSTGTDLADVGTECDGGVYDGYPGRETGSCDATGDCDTCNWYYIYNQPCKPSTGDLECWEFGAVTTCQGTCNSAPKTAGTTCSVDGLASTLPYTGKCDGAGGCTRCDDLYINKTACNNEACHVPSTYSCEGTCLSTSVYVGGTWCNAGFYPLSTRNPNTGQCGGNAFLYTGDGICTACNLDYLNNTPCYPVGVTEANKPCYNTQYITSCYGTCYPNYKGAGIPCDGFGNECNGAGVCTTPLATILAYNGETDKSCQTVCASSPYIGRGCIDIGVDVYGSGIGTNNYYRSVYLGYNLTGDCSTIMSSYYNKRYRTYCTCGNCKANYGDSCRTEDSCNYAMTYQCDGNCPTSYKANNLFCDPEGVNPNGYCYTGSCLPCTQVPNSACNVGECYNQGTYTCQGVCSTAANPYKTAGTVCSGGGVCNGAGTCVVPSPLFGTPCPYTPPKDSECYVSGTWNYDGSACVGTSVINNNAVCFTSTGTEGRCSAGDCVACDVKYNTDCPVNSPYNAYCYYAGKYDCPGTTCVGPYFKNQGSSGCGTESYICDSGKCVVGVVGQIYLNSASGKSCNQICEEHGYHCFSVGLDSLANDDNFYTWIEKKVSDVWVWVCDTSTASCSSVMSSSGGSCGGHTTDWTSCNCTNCNALAFTSCQSDPMYTGLNYDSECYNFGTYDCDGTCLGNDVLNEGGVCSNSSGVEGRCGSGVCNPCASSYLNGELCTPGSCATFVRECDGSCSTATTLGVGETCGVGLECTEAGACVPASSLPDIVVPNFATGQSCNSICSNYPDRTCESIGTDGTQAGGTNGKGNYYGLVDESPACVLQNSYCSTIFSRSPSLTTNPYYGYTCSGQLTDWTYCRCTNQ